jgi:uncharacterized membrane protein
MSLGAFLASFAATGVEVLETAVIVYAIVRGGYRREALAGAILAVVAWLALAPLGIAAAGKVPILLLRALAAAAVLVLGLIWIREVRQMRPTQASVQADTGLAPAAGRMAALVLCFKSAFVEGGEVMLVVAPVGLATQAWAEVLAGVFAALLAVTILIAMLHGQLQRLPERRLKLAAGLLCVLFGAGWLLEMALAAR